METMFKRTCPNCGKDFWRSLSQVNQRPYRCCSPECNIAYRNTTRDERFWILVDKSAGPDKCWHWTGYCGTNGYGQVKIRNRRTSPHRYAYELTFGPIPKGMVICHKCDNPPCCNPAHLFLGTYSDNTQDSIRKGRGYGGDRHWTKLHPERVIRGDKHLFHQHPELMQGENSNSAILTAKQVQEIRHLYATGNIKQRELAIQFGIDQTTVSSIVLHKLWKSIP